MLRILFIVFILAKQLIFGSVKKTIHFTKKQLSVVFGKHIEYISSFATIVETRAGYQSDLVMENADKGEVIYIGVLANRGDELCLLECGPTADYLSELQ